MLEPLATLDSVDDSIAAVHASRPAADAPVGQKAIWWHRTAGTLELIARHEADPDRARAVTADATTARRLARGLARTYVDRAAAERTPVDADEAVAW